MRVQTSNSVTWWVPGLLPLLKILHILVLTCKMPQMGETPLIRCAHNGHLHTVKFLVELGADVNSVDMVCSIACSSETSLLCLKTSVDPQGDNTALHWAAMRGHVEIVRFLLQESADRGMRNKQVGFVRSDRRQWTCDCIDNSTNTMLQACFCFLLRYLCSAGQAAN